MKKWWPEKGCHQLPTPSQTLLSGQTGQGPHPLLKTNSYSAGFPPGLTEQSGRAGTQWELQSCLLREDVTSCIHLALTPTLFLLALGLELLSLRDESPCLLTLSTQSFKCVYLHSTPPFLDILGRLQTY